MHNKHVASMLIPPGLQEGLKCCPSFLTVAERSGQAPAIHLWIRPDLLFLLGSRQAI